MTDAGVRWLHRVRFRDGEVIFREGEPGDQAYIVESGSVKIAKLIGGRPIILGTIERNGVFGEMALIDESERIATATAIAETMCIPVPKEVIRRQLASSDALVQKLVQVLLGNARNLNDLLTKALLDNPTRR